MNREHFTMECCAVDHATRADRIPHVTLLSRIAHHWPLILTAVLAFAAGVVVADYQVERRWKAALANAEERAARSGWHCVPDRRIAGLQHCLTEEYGRAGS